MTRKRRIAGAPGCGIHVGAVPDPRRMCRGGCSAGRVFGATGCGVGTDTADARVSVLTFERNACLERNSRDQLTARWESRPRPPDRNAPSLDHSLYSLAPEFREVLLLREGCELSYSQISKVVNAPVGLVVSRLSRARIRLHEKLVETRIRDSLPMPGRMTISDMRTGCGEDKSPGPRAQNRSRIISTTRSGTNPFHMLNGLMAPGSSPCSAPWR